jgi:hypothetical protein
MARSPQEIFQHHGGALVAGVRVTDGTDTVVFGADAIRVHTLHYSVQTVG